MGVRGRSRTERVLVVEEHGLVAMGLRLALSAQGWVVEIATGSDPQAVVAHAQRFEPQCVLLDIHLSSGMGRGIDLISPLASTGAHVVMLSAEERRLVLAQCLEAGAAGWIGKGATLDEVDAALGDVIAGRSIVGRLERAALANELQLDRVSRLQANAVFECLTKREVLVLTELVDGLSAEEIADAHFVALTTVRSQIHSVLQKLGVRSQLAAVAIAIAHRELLPMKERPGFDRRGADAHQLVGSGPALRR